MSNFLTAEERALLHRQHKKERDGRVRDRIKAVLLKDEGWTWMQIAHALLLSEEALRSQLKDYRNSKKLKPENGGSKEKLSSKQSKQLIDQLQKYTYLYVKDIVVYVKSAWGIPYSISGMRLATPQPVFLQKALAGSWKSKPKSSRSLDL